MQHHNDNILNPKIFLHHGIFRICIQQVYYPGGTKQRSPSAYGSIKPPGRGISVTGGIGGHWGRSEIRKVLLVPNTLQVDL